MQVREGLPGDEGEAFFKQVIGLTWKAHHDIRPDRGIRDNAADQVQFMRVVPGAITAVHGAQDGIRPRLQGQVRVTGEAMAGRTGKQG